MDINKVIAEELKIRTSQVEATVKLIDEGNTIPFIARYRKEATGSLNDEVLRDLYEKLTYLRSLEERKTSILASITEQGKLTDQLKADIDAAMTLTVLEDLYRPYKPKRVTRAQIAKKKGLEPLANAIMEQASGTDPEKFAAEFVTKDPSSVEEALCVHNVQEALAGASDILAESFSDNAAYRQKIRSLTQEKGHILSTAKDASAESVYEQYYDFNEPVSSIAGHRVLALNRGEAQKILTVKIEAPVEQILSYMGRDIITGVNPACSALLHDAINDSYNRLIAPSIEREIRNELTEKAEDGAISVFGKNLEQLLMQPPIAGKTVLGWDPAFRTGCKLAIIDPTGKVLDTKVIYPTAPQNKVTESLQILKDLINKYKIDLISLGNGTASRESEQIIVDLIRGLDRPLSYVIVNEAGASVYSASKLATVEFPNFDVGQRSAASIARRLQDPLAELVKIDPKSIGVGQYQHDMNQKKLDSALTGVVEKSVNRVGVDLNTASAPLLSYISGISSTIAKNIVEYREKNGRFDKRSDLLKVPKLGPKAYEQCAGFLRITGGSNPLDETSVHPESYAAAEKILTELGLDIKSIRSLWMNDDSSHPVKKIKDRKKLAEKLSIGEITLNDILKELEKPSRDPRTDLPSPILRQDVLSMEDLKPGMTLKGTVRNVIDFGVFVDIGVHQDGLVHISQLSDRYVKHPLDVVSVGDIVEVRVLDVDIKKKRISLTMKSEKKA